jgi:hypothetical protein
LLSLSAARLAGEGQQTKMEMIYRYLTGPRFRHRIEAVVERFTEMQADLDRERKAMTGCGPSGKSRFTAWSRRWPASIPT